MSGIEQSSHPQLVDITILVVLVILVQSFHTGVPMELLPLQLTLSYGHISYVREAYLFVPY